MAIISLRYTRCAKRYISPSIPILIYITEYILGSIQPQLSFLSYTNTHIYKYSTYNTTQYTKCLHHNNNNNKNPPPTPSAQTSGSATRSNNSEFVSYPITLITLTINTNPIYGVTLMLTLTWIARHIRPRSLRGAPRRQELWCRSGMGEEMPY